MRLRWGWQRSISIETERALLREYSVFQSANRPTGRFVLRLQSPESSHRTHEFGTRLKGDGDGTGIAENWNAGGRVQSFAGGVTGADAWRGLACGNAELHRSHLAIEFGTGPVQRSEHGGERDRGVRAVVHGGR